MKVFKGIDGGAMPTGRQGFTLVELLIVIALIAILSVAVLATINPVEQTNKARDARVQNDAAEVMNAAERYYASTQQYPWESFADNLTSADPVVLGSTDLGFGICNGTGAAATLGDAVDPATSCSSADLFPNLLISTSELKSSFAGKDEFQPILDATNPKPDQAMWLAKTAAGNAFYVCYIPKAGANRNIAANMRCITTAGVVNKIGTGGCLAATTANWTTATTNPESFITTGVTAIFRCIPE